MCERLFTLMMPLSLKSQAKSNPFSNPLGMLLFVWHDLFINNRNSRIWQGHCREFNPLSDAQNPLTWEQISISNSGSARPGCIITHGFDLIDISKMLRVTEADQYDNLDPGLCKKAGPRRQMNDERGKDRWLDQNAASQPLLFTKREREISFPRWKTRSLSFFFSISVLNYHVKFRSSWSKRLSGTCQKLSIILTTTRTRRMLLIWWPRDFRWLGWWVSRQSFWAIIASHLPHSSPPHLHLLLLLPSSCSVLHWEKVDLSSKIRGRCQISSNLDHFSRGKRGEGGELTCFSRSKATRRRKGSQDEMERGHWEEDTGSNHCVCQWGSGFLTSFYRWVSSWRIWLSYELNHGLSALSNFKLLQFQFSPRPHHNVPLRVVYSSTYERLAISDGHSPSTPCTQV